MTSSGLLNQLLPTIYFTVSKICSYHYTPILFVLVCLHLKNLFAIILVWFEEEADLFLFRLLS